MGTSLRPSQKKGNSVDLSICKMFREQILENQMYKNSSLKGWKQEAINI